MTGRRRTRPVMPPDLLVALYVDDGMSLKALGRMYRRTPEEVAAALREQGVQLRPLRAPRPRGSTVLPRR